MRKNKQITLVPYDKFDHLVDHYYRAKSQSTQIAILNCMVGPANTYERCRFVYTAALINSKLSKTALQKLKTLANEKSSDP